MNTQRWIALGFVVAVVVCITSSNLWLAPFMNDDEEAESTQTPDAADIAELETTEEPAAEESADPAEAMLAAEAEPTPLPAVVDIMADMGIEELGVGLDPHIILGGDFEVIDPLHQGRGTALVYWFSEQQRFLRFENFEVTSGPDLQVILSQHEAPRTSAEALLPSHLRVGALKNASGTQNYEIPSDADLSRYQSAVIYSTSLNIVYSSAPLEEVRGQ